MGLLAVYLAIKLSVYCLWCWYGLKVPGAAWPTGFKTVIFLGAARLAAGLIAGWLLVFSLSWLAPVQNRIGFSLLVFYPALVFLRWLEWSLISSVIRRSPADFVWGRSLRDNLWRLGGIAVSSASDASVVLVIGVLGWVPC